MISLWASLLAAAALGAEPAADAPGEPAPTVRHIRIQRKNVFDLSVPGEDLWVFRAANRIHVLTRESVVAHDVLLQPGAPYDPLRALETERNLRSLGFLRHANVLALPAGPGQVDLEVRTQDSWTLQPQLSVGTEGGEHFFIVGVKENNLLGLGKTVSFFHSERGPDLRNELRYADPRVWGTFHRLTAHYADTDKGDEVGARVARPFVSLLDPRSADTTWASILQEETLYRNGGEFSHFLHDFRAVKGRYGRRLGRWGPFVHRAHAGYLYERSRFRATDETVPGTLPAGRALSAPLAGYSWIQPRYYKTTDVDSMKRVEDFNLGNELSLTAGPSLDAWGGDRDRWVFAALNQQGLELGPGRFALAQVGVQGRRSEGDWENALFFANINLFWKALWPFRQTFVSHLEFNAARRLDGEKQLILGGNTGLRGYRNNAFTGGKTLLLNLEDRFFWDREIFHLLYMGGVAFLDTGLAAPEAGSPRLRDLKTDVGLGLRFSSSRSASGAVVRLDVAYALNDGPGRGRWVVSLRGGQAFAIFNSTNRQALSQPDDVLGEERAASRLLNR